MNLTIEGIEYAKIYVIIKVRWQHFKAILSNIKRIINFSPIYLGTL